MRVCFCGGGSGAPVAWGSAVSAALLDAGGGGEKGSGGASPPKKATSSGLKLPVVRACHRTYKSVHRTFCHLYSACKEFSLNSCWIRRRRAAGKVGYWRACKISCGRTPGISCRGETASGRSREARARQIARAEEPQAQDARATKQARPETKKQEGTRVKIRLS